MATASKKSSTTSVQTDEPFQHEYNEKDYCSALTLCNNFSHAIKFSPDWETMDRSKSTYFILPEEPNRFRYILRGIDAGTIQPDPTDFERFWFKLSYWHKERRLLANYMATYNEIQRAIDGENADQTKSTICDVINDVAQTLRSYTLERNKTTFRDEIFLYFLVANSFDYAKQVYGKLMLERSTATLYRADSIFLDTKASEEVLGKLAYLLISFTFSGGLNSFFIWISLNIDHIQPYLPREVMLFPVVAAKSGRQWQEEFMRKLSLASPRWSKSDRQFMLQAIETNGKSCRGTYVHHVFDKVGVERFKKLVFGKHRFCAQCKRSSYIGEDRLLACKRCDVEGIRPRAWYCGKECQRGDWIKHKAAKHTPVEKALEKTNKKKEKKKRKPRK